MKKKLMISLLAGLIGVPTVGFAQDSKIRVRAGLSSVNYVSPSTTPGNPDFKSTYAALIAGGSLITSSGLFVDLGIRKSLSAEWNATDLNWANDDDFARNEITLTLGKALDSGFAVFGGVQSSTAEATLSTANTGLLSDIVIETTGRLLFCGVSKSMPLGSGSLNVSLAVGLYGQTTDNNVGAPSEKSTNGGGASLGGSYSLPLGNGLSLIGDLRYQSYAVEYSGDPSKENVGSASLALAAQF